MIKITITNKLDVSNGFYIKNNMHAVEWKLNAMVKKNKKSIKKLDRKWRYLLVRKINHVPVLDKY